MTFVEYIKTQGYELIPRKGKEDDFSTMGVLSSSYKKGDIVITWGLHEYGKPPSLCSPRPYTQIVTKQNGLYHCQQFDDHATVERIMKSLSNEELLKRIENKQLKIELQ